MHSISRIFGSVAVLMAALAAPPSAGAQIGEPFYTNEGRAGIVRRLGRVQSGVRVLHVAAHPDDEDSALLAYLSQGRGARVTYLSLTRGEGGQNLIGPELFTDLGIVRSEELLAARRIDGAHQLFGRMIDFGFSKSAEECFALWGRDAVVEDIVRAIRLTRPHIVYSRFQGGPQDGHGQHQTAAIGTREAIEAAADPARYPEQIAQGLEPWKIQKFYIGASRRGNQPALEIDTGQYDPWTGRSFASIGYRGRSQHRSQDMGMIEYEFVRPSRVILETPQGDSNGETDLFDGLHPSPLELDPSVGELLRLPGALSDSELLARQLARMIGSLDRDDVEDRQSVYDLEAALAGALGIRLEAFADREALIQGGEVSVICDAYYPPTTQLENIRWSLESSEGLTTSDADESAEVTGDQPGFRYAAPGRSQSRAAFTLSADPDAEPSLPYYLRSKGSPFLYEWPDDGRAGLPFERPAAVARFEAEAYGTKLSLIVPVEHRRADPAFGEIRGDLSVLPPSSVWFDPPVQLTTLGQPPETIRSELVVENISERPLTQNLEVYEASRPQRTIATFEVTLGPGQTQRIEFSPLTKASEAGRLSYRVRLREDAGGSRPTYHVERIDYRHIRPRYLCRRPQLEIHRTDLLLAPDLDIGYVMATGDEVADALEQWGARVHPLEESDLSSGDLSRFDTIVLGARAYEVRPDLAANNDRLLDYARNGGTLVVQYNKYAFARNEFAPFPMTMARPHDRVTDEAAEVVIRQPEHAIFHYPNRIGAEDFGGWIQERGLYFWETWDERYVALLSCADPGEEAKLGGMMYARIGQGHYIYTGYSFLRQLPAGVDGACRLFANIVSLGHGAPGE